MNSKILIVQLMMFLTIINAQNSKQQKETLTDLINSAVSVSPKIKMLQAKYKVAKAQIEIGTNLPDPVLTLGLANMPTNTFSFTQEPMTGKIVGLSQAIPFPGALSSAAAVKSVDTAIVKTSIEDLKNKIRKEVAEYYYTLQYLRENIKYARESISLLRQISEVVKRKYDVGSASLQNLVQIEVQITRVKDKIETLEAKERSTVSKLNALLLRKDDADIFTPNLPQINYKELKTDSGLEVAVKNRPLLQSIRLASRKAELMKDAAEYSFYPNFKLSLQYSQRDYNAKTSNDYIDFFSVMVGISLPINYGGNKTEQVNRAVYLRSLYDEQYNTTLQNLQKSIGTVNSKLLEMNNREKLITTELLPQAKQAFDAAMADYKVGKIDFANVIKAENDILNIKTELAKVRTDFYKNLYSLEYLLGKEIKNIANNSTETNDEK